MPVYQQLLSVSERRGAAYLVLVDPDKTESKTLPEFADRAQEAGADGFLVGGSLVMNDAFERAVAALKSRAKVPVIVFPGSLHQISGHADAILFLSILSGRNPEHLIGNQVVAAPIIKRLGLEAISTAYLLVESGKPTSAEFMSNTRPIPRSKPDIAVAHALAAEYLGFKLVYLEGGSGAEQPVPDEMISAVARSCSIPLVVGGGIRDPETARKKVKAGARFIVTGNVLEQNGERDHIRSFASAIHGD